MNAVILAILNTFWQAAAITAAVWLALRLTRGTNAATRHALWWAVLAVMVLLPAIPSRRTELPAPAAARAVHEESLEVAPPIVGPRQPIVYEAAPSARGLELPAGRWPTILLAVWTVLCIVQIGRTVWSYCHLRRLKREARPADAAMRQNFDAWMLSCQVRRPARLLVSNKVISPIAVGFRDPAVILPESLLAAFDAEAIDHVLLHELAHMARRDDWTNLAARVASGVLALHPVALWVVRQIDREREMACDDWVVAMTGEARPYATSLTRLFELCRSRNRVLLASGMATRASHLGERIEMLLRARRQFFAKASVVKVAFACVALVAAGLAFSQTPRMIAFSQDIPPAAPAPPEPPAAPEPHSAAEPPQAPGAPEAPVPPPPSEPAEAAAPPAPPQPPAPPVPPNGGFLAGLVAAGYGDLPVDEIIHLKQNSVDAAYIVGMARSGWGRVDTRELIELRNNGVSPEYARAARGTGIDGLTIKEVIHLRQNGVDPETVRRIHALGFGPYRFEDVIALRNSGVPVELFQAFKDAGWKSLAARDAIEAQNAGVRASSLREARQYGSSLTIKQIVRLKQAGVI